MKRYISVVLVFLSLLFFTIITFLQFTHEAVAKREESKYRREFMKIPDIKGVVDFVYYEGYTAATLILRDGTRLHISKFSDSTFISTDKIELTVINDLAVVCSDEKGFSSIVIGGVFNTIEFVQMKKPSLQIRNLQELLFYHDIIYGLFDSLPKCVYHGTTYESKLDSLSKCAERAERIDFKRESLWCVTIQHHPAK